MNGLWHSGRSFPFWEVCAYSLDGLDSMFNIYFIGFPWGRVCLWVSCVLLPALSMAEVFRVIGSSNTHEMPSGCFFKGRCVLDELFVIRR